MSNDKTTTVLANGTVRTSFSKGHGLLLVDLREDGSAAVGVIASDDTLALTDEERTAVVAALTRRQPSNADPTQGDTMSNDRTVIGVKYFDDTTVNEMSESPSVMLHQEKPGVPYYPDEARSLAAALVRHADAIDPPDKNDTATSRGLDALGEAMRSVRTEIVDADDGEPMIRVTEPEVFGWVVLNDGAVELVVWRKDGHVDAQRHAVETGGTVRELHLGPVIHDASGPKQCEWKPSAYPDEATGCWRNVHRAGRHVWETSVGHLVFSSASDSIAEAIVAAVRDRDEREGR